MKKTYLFYFCLNIFPCLVQAVGLNDVPEGPKKNTVEFLDQKSWDALLQVNTQFRELTLQAITAIQVKGTAESIIQKLTALLFEGDAQGKMHESLESLDLSGSSLGDDQLGTVVDFIQEHFPNIKSLNLHYNNIGEAGAAHLARIDQLEILDLSWNNIRDSGAAHLARITQLKILKLDTNNIGDIGAKHLARLNQLQKLDLYNNGIKDSGAAHLARMTQLKTLNLSGNQIGNVGAATLANLNKLQKLVLSDNRIGDAGITNFFGLTKLKVLSLFFNNISAPSIDSLKQALPDCKIYF